MAGLNPGETAGRERMDFTFLICTERSGSNFITSLFNGHGRVCGPSPTHLFRLFVTNAHRYGDLSVDVNWSELVEDFVANFNAQLGKWATAPDFVTLHARAKPRSVAELLRLTYEAEAEAADADHLFVKENHTYSLVPYLREYFPNCRFIHLVRDPRDVAASWIITQSIPGGVERAIDIWVSDQAATAERLDSPDFSDAIFTVRYEDLLVDTEGWMREASMFLGLPFDDAMLRAHENQLTRANADRIEAWANLGRSVLSGNAGKYREVLSADDVRYIELRCGDLMTRFGYECDFGGVIDSAARAGEIEMLRNCITPGSHAVQPEEQLIREQRRLAMDRVLSRSPRSR